ncbi:hypothetical protein XENTR_v10000349, partial [Xenopus tropicalis]
VFAGAGLRVTQIPGTLSVTEGGNANITCSWDAEYEDERIRVWWKIYYESPRAAHNGTVLANVMWANNKSEVRITSRDQSDYRLMKDKAELWLFSVNKSDAGTYICEVTIDKPELRSGKGTGTILYVTDSSSSTVSGIRIHWSYIVISLAILLAFIIGTILIVCVCKRRSEPTALYSDHTYGNYTKNEKHPRRKISAQSKKHHPSKSINMASVEKRTKKQQDKV